jgi:hypothetical protein
VTTAITDTEMSSDATPHTATARPVVPGEPTRWSVTWLPGRALTRDQAITAMTIAEIVADRAHAQTGTEAWRPHLTAWAAELGLTPDEATELLGKSDAARAATRQAWTECQAARAKAAARTISTDLSTEDGMNAWLLDNEAEEAYRSYNDAWVHEHYAQAELDETERQNQAEAEM